MTTSEIARKLVEYCRQGKHEEAIRELYHDECETVEAAADPQGNKQFKGKDTALARNQWWAENHEVHSVDIEPPLVSPEHFAVHFKYDVTSRPMDNRRMTLDELGVYQVKDGKVIREEFFYGGM